jgi:preprotein translocase subunit SecE
MAENTQMLDKVKLGFAGLLAAAGIAGYYLLGSQTIVLRVLAVIAGFAAGAGLAATSQPGREFIAFARESTAEVRKVVWPTRKETTQTTGAVFAFVVVMALFLWLSDKTLEWVLYELILGWKKG